jgi:hypothetical protein
MRLHKETTENDYSFASLKRSLKFCPPGQCATPARCGCACLLFSPSSLFAGAVVVVVVVVVVVTSGLHLHYPRSRSLLPSSLPPFPPLDLTQALTCRWTCCTSARSCVATEARARSPCPGPRHRAAGPAPTSAARRSSTSTCTCGRTTSPSTSTSCTCSAALHCTALHCTALHCTALARCCAGY